MNERYTKKLTRLLRIIKELDSGSLRLAILAEELGVSLRTIQRDMASLEEAQFPLQYSSGKYSFVKGFSLKKSNTNNEEATTLVLLSEISKSLGKKFENSFDNIRKKVLCTGDDSPFYIKMPKTNGYPKTKITDKLEEAVAENRILDIVYLKRDDSIYKHRVHPYKIVNFEGFWYLYAIENGKKHTFKLERILDCTLTNKPFTPKKTILKRMEDATNIWFGLNKKERILLSVDAQVAKYFKTKEYFPLQKIIKTRKNGDVIIETTVSAEGEVLHNLFYWIPSVQIIKPAWLKKIAASRVKKFIRDSNKDK